MKDPIIIQIVGLKWFVSLNYKLMTERSFSRSIKRLLVKINITAAAVHKIRLVVWTFISRGALNLQPLEIKAPSLPQLSIKARSLSFARENLN